MSLQELLDDSMDIKIKIIDDMLFAVVAFAGCSFDIAHYYLADSSLRHCRLGIPGAKVFAGFLKKRSNAKLR